MKGFGDFVLNDIDLKAVDLFLKTAKKEIKKGNRYFVINRVVYYDDKKISAKNALGELGILNIEEVWNYILKLNAKDCFRISRDYDLKRDYNDDMYEFIIIVNRIKTYIKLTINNKGTVCLSFHKSNRN